MSEAQTLRRFAASDEYSATESAIFDSAALEIETLRKALRECADELEVRVEAQYARTKHYPSEMRRYERDIKPVRNAAKAIGEK